MSETLRNLVKEVNDVRDEQIRKMLKHIFGEGFTDLEMLRMLNEKGYGIKTETVTTMSDDFASATFASTVTIIEL